jgi:hypothetical protein
MLYCFPEIIFSASVLGRAVDESLFGVTINGYV